MKTQDKINIYNNGHSSTINLNGDCKQLNFSDLKDYINKKVTAKDLAEKYFNV